MLSSEPKIGDAAKMSPLEKRLARRIHNQRRRLRQMEAFESWRNGEKAWNIKAALCKMVMERGRKISELEAKIAELSVSREPSSGERGSHD